MGHIIEVDGLTGGMLMLTFSEGGVREEVQINRTVIDAIERGFIDLVIKDVQMPPIMRLDIPKYHG